VSRRRHPSPVSGRTVGWLAVACCASLAGYPLLTDRQQDVAWSVSGFGSVLVLLAGVRRNRPAKRWPWLALAAGVAVSNCADLMLGVADWVGRELPDPGPQDAVYVLGYIPLLAGVLGMLARGDARQDRENTLDALILALGAAALGFVVLVRPMLADPRVRPDSLPSEVGVLVYLALDLLIFAVLCRVALGGLRRNPSVWLACAGMSMWLVGDAVNLRLAAPSAVLADVVDELWLAAYWLFALAALHPAMTRIGTRPLGQHRPPGAPRLAVLVLAGLLNPVLVALLGHHGPSGTALVVLGCTGAALFAVVSLRMWLLLAASGRQVSELARLLRDKHELETTLRRMALNDQLTDLANRAAFTQTVSRSLAGGQPGLLLMIDLDGFKQVNDTLGHAAGDQLLVAAALRFGRTLRAEDTLARLGGDEFAAWLPEVRTTERAAQTAGRLTDACRDAFTLRAGTARVTASVGAALSGPGDNLDTLLARADHAMYEAKRAGKNAFVLAAPARR
jgi:diguanylate cyclase (GGDEF)-like protein